MTCRRCAFFKRRDNYTGTCWHPSQVPAFPHPESEKGEGETCPKWERRVVMVEAKA